MNANIQVPTKDTIDTAYTGDVDDAKFRTCMGLPIMQWDEQLDCQKGDLYHNQSQLIVWNAAYFPQVNVNIGVPTKDTIDTAYAGHRDISSITTKCDGPCMLQISIFIVQHKDLTLKTL